MKPPGMHMVFLPWKDDVREPEADPEFRGETWQTATATQARLRPRACRARLSCFL